MAASRTIVKHNCPGGPGPCIAVMARTSARRRYPAKRHQLICKTSWPLSHKFVTEVVQISSESKAKTRLLENDRGPARVDVTKVVIHALKAIRSKVALASAGSNFIPMHFEKARTYKYALGIVLLLLVLLPPVCQQYLAKTAPGHSEIHIQPDEADFTNANREHYTYAYKILPEEGPKTANNFALCGYTNLVQATIHSRSKTGDLVTDIHERMHALESFDHAIRDLRIARTLNPSDETTLAELAECLNRKAFYSGTGDCSEYESLLLPKLQIPEAQMVIGNDHFRRKRYARAIEYYTTAIATVQKTPDMPRKDREKNQVYYYYNRARAYIEVQDFNSALKDLNKIGGPREAVPDYMHDLNYYRGLCAEATGDTKAAIAFFDQWVNPSSCTIGSGGFFPPWTKLESPFEYEIGWWLRKDMAADHIRVLKTKLDKSRTL